MLKIELSECESKIKTYEKTNSEQNLEIINLRKMNTSSVTMV